MYLCLKKYTNRTDKEIQLYALSPDFLHINILTNGVVLTKEIKDIIICNRDRVFVQIILL